MGQTTGIYNSGNTLVSNGNPPPSPQANAFQLVLISGAAQALDLKPLANLHRIKNIQGIFVDNSAGSSAVSISTAAGQNFIVPTSYQGVMPLYLSADQVLTISGDGNVNFVLLNFPTPASVWPTATTGVVSISGTVTVTDATAEGYLANLQPTLNALSSGSTTSPATPASTALFVANPVRKYLFIQSAYNVGASVFHDLWVNILGGTCSVGGTDCIRIAAGTNYESENFVSGSAINYYDAVGSNEITAIQQ